MRPIDSGDDGELSAEQVAGYVAKYATKSTETTGHLSTRLTDTTVDLYADPATHAGRLIDACWTLGRHRDWHGLRRWAHVLGFGGHFSTKSRRYSTTLRALRAARRAWQQRHLVETREHGSDAETLVVGAFSFAGIGWRSTGDALLATTAAALARERRRIAREETAPTRGVNT